MGPITIRRRVALCMAFKAAWAIARDVYKFSKGKSVLQYDVFEFNYKITATNDGTGCKL